MVVFKLYGSKLTFAQTIREESVIYPTFIHGIDLLSMFFSYCLILTLVLSAKRVFLLCVRVKVRMKLGRLW